MFYGSRNTGSQWNIYEFRTGVWRELKKIKRCAIAKRQGHA